MNSTEEIYKAYIQNEIDNIYKLCEPLLNTLSESFSNLYKKSNNTNCGLFILVDVGEMGRKYDEIKNIKAENESAGKTTSEIVYIDAREKPSTSKKKPNGCK